MNSSINVGRVTKVLVDKTRKEFYEENKEFRSFPISIFYPTEEITTESNLISLFHTARNEAIDVFSKVGISKEQLNEVKTFVKEHAEPVRNISFPVLLLSPGFGIDRDLYIEVITAIVQKGYIVITVSVPYDSFLTVFTNNKIVYQAKEFPDDQTQVLTRMKDMQFVIEQLEKWNHEEYFNGLFDTSKIGALGHSLGGVSVLNLASIDNRIRCVILFDASLYLTGEKIPEIPVLNIRQEASSYDEFITMLMEEESKAVSEVIATTYIEKQLKLYEHLPVSRSFIKIIGANHLSFSTIGRFITEEPQHVMTSIQDITIAYLEEFLKGRTNIYLDKINGITRPIGVVEIDGRGLQL
ncbi:alpha/beta hydrolase family protein [Bacillus sp. PS06]|uniref:alpha/beta hydrolase family protein n=1 Tax=Bacillus sp. PS06 TaxID=2764176 RepID=UPI00177DC717|nr:hypothetical protein [Bacillus sp. PS06]MBD8067848.1 hypothetical protein [Bacillus sp. PS06]